MAEPILNENTEKAQSESNLSITSNDIKIDLNKEFMVELRKNMYHETHYEDVVDHIAKVLKMVDLIYVPGVDFHQLRRKVFPLSLADDAKEWWISYGDEKITTWEELVEKFFCRFYPESYDGEDKMLDEGENWGIDPLEFLSNINTSFKYHKIVDGRTQKVIFHAWMNGNWNKRYVDNKDIATCLVEYVKLWDDWEVDRYGNANLAAMLECNYGVIGERYQKARILELKQRYFEDYYFEDQYAGELLSLAASAGFEHGLSMHRTKDEFDVVLKKMDHFVSGAQGRLAEASPLDAHVSPPIAKESTVTPASESLEFPTNVVPVPSVVASEQNKEWVNAMVDGPDLEITDGVANAKPGSIFVQGTSCALDDTVGVTEVGLERASSDTNDVVVALSTRKKGDGSLPSSAADEEAAANPFGV
ncbi:hypothetical protein Tco_1143747 [Tanacetum coccineum]